MRNARVAAFLTAAALVSLAGCRSAQVRRSDEIARFKKEMQVRTAALEVDPAVPLTMERCVEIALQNSLDYRVSKLREKLQDEQVRIAFSDFLPKPGASYAATRRSNEALLNQGGVTLETEDRNQQSFNVQAVLPILDWGSTYYAYQNAKDRRLQERLAVQRAGQTLVRDVRVAYARLASLQRQERLARVGLFAARELLRTAQSLEREGLGAHAETASVEASLAQAALQWSTIRRGVEQTRLALAQLMSFPAGTAFSIVDMAPLAPPLLAPADIPALEESALGARPELLIQDRERRIAANTVRKQFAQFLPRVDGAGSYDWLSQSGLVNPGFFRFGVLVTHSLLSGGEDIWRYRLDRKAATVEEERALLLSLAILYDVDFRVLQVYTAYDAVVTREAVVRSQQEALKQIISLYLQGFETGIDAARSLAEMYLARLQLDQVQTDYQVAWYELQAAALSEAEKPAPPSETGAVPPPLPVYQPAPSLDTLRKMLELAPPIDLRQFPELQELLNPGGNVPK